jgi:hypothetical protein
MNGKILKKVTQMKTYQKSFLFFSMAFLGTGFLTLSGNDDDCGDHIKKRFNRKYNDIYDKERYFNADKDGDGVLSYAEWDAALKDKEQGGGRWDAREADTDGDGIITLMEAKQSKKLMKRPTAKALWEAYQNQNDDEGRRELLRKFIKNHPELAKKTLENKDWLKSHPKVAKELFQHREWLEKHPDIAKKMYEHREWLSDHPKATREMYKNREWLNDHPKASKKIYRNRKLLNDHPEASKKLYRNRFRLKNRSRYSKRKTVRLSRASRRK